MHETRSRLAFTLIGLSCLCLLSACQRTLVVRFATSSMPQALEASPAVGLPWVDERVLRWLGEERRVVVDVAGGCSELPQGDRPRCLLLEASLAEDIARTGRVVTRASSPDYDPDFHEDSLVIRADMPTRERRATETPPAFRVGDDLDDLELDAAGRCSLVVEEALSALPIRSEAEFVVAWSRGSHTTLFRTTERAQGDAALDIASVTVRFEHRTPHGKTPAFGRALQAAAAAGRRRQRHDDEETDLATRSLGAMGAAMTTLVADGIMARRDFCTVEGLPTASYESQMALLMALDRVLAARVAKRLPVLTP